MCILVSGGAGFIVSHLSVAEVAEWLNIQTASELVDAATAELVSRGVAR